MTTVLLPWQQYCYHDNSTLTHPLQLDGVKPVTGGEWSEAAKTALNEQIAEQEVTLTLPALEKVTVESESVVVDMMIEGVSVAETLKNSKVGCSIELWLACV